MSVNAHGDVTQEADSQSGHVRGAEADNSTTVNIITNSSDENAEPVSIELSNDHGTTTVTVGNSRTSENEPKLVPTTAHNDAPTKTDLHSSTAKAHAKQTGTNQHDRPASMLATKTKHGWRKYVDKMIQIASKFMIFYQISRKIHQQIILNNIIRFR